MTSLPQPHIKKKEARTKADKAAKWNKTNDKKLLAFVDPENQNGINLSRGKENIKKIHSHWPHRSWKNFASLIWSKLSQLKVAQTRGQGQKM
jgi:phage-related protein